MLLLKNFIEQNELCPVLIKKNGELEKNIKMLVFHQILQMKLPTILKRKQEITIPEWLFEERKIFTVRLPYASANETFSMLFVNKIEDYTNGKAALSLKFGHCYFLRDFFDALCSNY